MQFDWAMSNFSKQFQAFVSNRKEFINKFRKITNNKQSFTTSTPNGKHINEMPELSVDITVISNDETHISPTPKRKKTEKNEIHAVKRISNARKRILESEKEENFWERLSKNDQFKKGKTSLD